MFLVFGAKAVMSFENLFVRVLLGTFGAKAAFNSESPFARFMLGAFGGFGFHELREKFLEGPV